MTIVVDASALAAVVYREPEHPAVSGRLAGAGTLCAPTLLPYEMANVCRIKARRHPDLEALLEAQFEGFLKLDIDYVTPDFTAASVLARRHGLTVYDAAYLWLALVHGAPLVTLDRQLDDAWRRAGSPD